MSEDIFINHMRIILKENYIDKDKCIKIKQVNKGDIIPDDITMLFRTYILNEINFQYNFIIKQKFIPTKEIAKQIEDNFYDDLRIKYN